LVVDAGVESSGISARFKLESPVDTLDGFYRTIFRMADPNILIRTQDLEKQM
jgi:hypothetical protein